jgi:hypothetical protein
VFDANDKIVFFGRACSDDSTRATCGVLLHYRYWLEPSAGTRMVETTRAGSSPRPRRVPGDLTAFETDLVSRGAARRGYDLLLLQLRHEEGPIDVPSRWVRVPGTNVTGGRYRDRPTRRPGDPPVAVQF